MADDAGALLVRSGLITASALDEARAKVAQGGGTVGEQLVAAGAVRDDALTDFYRSRFLLPQVNPNTLARLTAKVIATLPGDMAIELRAIPVALDGENNLTVAMSDPSDRHAVDEIAFFTGTYVVRAVATQMQIAWCLAHYYSHMTSLGQRLVQPTQPAQPAARAPRTKGLTGEIAASRHRGIVPGSANVSGEMTASPAPDAAATEPRPRSVSGEIRVPVRRAPSIRPPMPTPHGDDEGDDDAVITVEAGLADDEQTGKRKMLPVRRQRIVKADPPELAARAGEVELATGRERSVDADGPRIIIDEQALSPPPVAAVIGELRVVAQRDTAVMPSSTIEVDGDSVVISDQLGDPSGPVVLTQRRPTEAPLPGPLDDDTDDTNEIVVLDAPKRVSTETPAIAKPRPNRSTQVGIGATPAATRAHRDTEASAAPTHDDATRVDGLVAPDLGDFTDETIPPPSPALRDDDTNPFVLAAPPKQTLVGVASHADHDFDDDSIGPATAVMSAVELDTAIPQRLDHVLPAHLDKTSPQAFDPVDDGWGPPGTTIPPPLLGAIPGTDDTDGLVGIPVADVDSAPLIIAPPSPPESARGASGPTAARSLLQQLEEATQRVFELIHALERAGDRDAIVKLVVAHLAETHRRAGFFSIRHGSARLGPARVNELVTFSIHPPSGKPLPTYAVRLDRPSTLQDVVGTRLPYRGPMLDDASRHFLAQVLGTSPPEILLVPVAIRERVVGVFFGEHRLRHTFDDQLALAARAAGSAFERALMKR